MQHDNHRRRRGGGCQNCMQFSRDFVCIAQLVFVYLEAPIASRLMLTGYMIHSVCVWMCIIYVYLAYTVIQNYIIIYTVAQCLSGKYVRFIPPAKRF